MVPDWGLLYNTTYKYEHVLLAAGMSWVVWIRALTGIAVRDNNFSNEDGGKICTAKLQV